MKNRNRWQLVLLAAGLVVFSFSTGCQKPQSCLDGEAFVQAEEWEKAVDSLTICLNEVQGAPFSGEAEKAKVQLQIDLIKDKITGATVAQAERLMKDGKTLVEHQNAITLLKTKARYDNGKAEIAAVLSRYESQLVKLKEARDQYVTVAQTMKAEGNWQAGYAAIAQAIAIDTENQGLVQQRTGIIQARDQHYMQTIQSNCDNAQYALAQETLGKWLAEDPVPVKTVADPIVNKVKAMTEKAVRAKLEAYLKNKQYYSAYVLFHQVKVGNCDDLYARIQKDGAEYYKNLGYKEQAQAHDYLAYVASAKADLINSKDAEIDQLKVACEDRMQELLKVKIGVADFESPKDKSDIGKEITASIIARLTKRLPYGVHIDEPTKPRFDINQNGLVKTVVLLNHQYAIFGNVTNFVTSDNSKVVDKTAVVKLVDEEPNPQYDLMLATHGADQTRWPYIPEKSKKKERFETIKYQAGEKHLEGLIIVIPRLYSAEEDRVVASEEFKAPCKIDDTYQDAVEVAGIKEDPLEEKETMLDVERKIKEEVVEKVVNWCMDYFEPRQRYYLDKVRYHQGRQEKELAIQYAALGYYYCLHDPDKVLPTDEDFLTLKQLALLELTE